MLSASGMSKNFGGVRALDRVDFDLRPGEVHGLLGENGAGKSTLMKILAGVYPADEGHITLEGKVLQLRDPKQAHDEGIRIVYQELSLVPDLSVAENLFLHRFSAGGLTLVNRRQLAAEAHGLLDQWDLNIPPQVKVESLPMGKRQLVEIAREVAKKGKVLILDEPTSSLTNPEIDRLFSVLERLKEAGVGVIFISHRLDEVMRIADRVTVLRNGRKVATREAASLPIGELVNLIVGRDIKDLYPKTEVPIGGVLLSVKGLSGEGFQEVSFDLHSGEILGVAGLIGAGRSEVLRSIFGVNPVYGGSLELDEQHIHPDRPERAISLGLAMLPEARGQEGVFPDLTVGKNLVLMSLKEVSAALGRLVKKLIDEKVADLVKDLSVITYDPHHQTVAQLSGGNQQKVVLGRLLGAHPRILLLDEPTRGVDVGTKAEIHKIMGQFVSEGNSIIAVSSDIPELIGVCDRIIVLHQGSMAGLYERRDFNEEEILRCAMGLNK